MTVEEMKEAIKNKCINIDYRDCYLCLLYDTEGSCYEDLKSEEIKRNYELMFGKEESKMKNEFDFNELKAGWAIKVPAYEDELLIGFQIMNDILFYSKEHNLIITKCEIMNDLLEVYGLSNNEHLFDSNTRPLIWKKEDKNFKVYEIGNLEIRQNYKEYKTEKEDFLFIENINENDEYVTIRKSELDAIINALTEIRDFIKEGE